MSGNVPSWQLFRSNEKDSTHDAPSDILTQLKNPWPSVKENGMLQMLDQETKNNGSHVTNMPLIEGDNNNQKKRKFGSFMGKLLLKSGSNINKPVPKTSKERILKQQVLTEEPFAGLFRLRKNRNNHITGLDQDSGALKDGIKFKLKFACHQTKPEQGNITRPDFKDKGNISNSNTTDSIDNAPKYRLINGRRTRWDIQSYPPHSNAGHKSPAFEDSSSLILSQHHQVLRHVDKEVDAKKNSSSSEEDDDSSFVESLQSDDDILGPWIELGMLEPLKDNNSMKEPEIKNNFRDCQDCIDVNASRDCIPLKEVTLCSACTTEWNIIFQNFASKLALSKVTINSKSKIKRQPKKTKFNDITLEINKKQKLNNRSSSIKKEKTPQESNIENKKLAGDKKRCGSIMKTVNRHTKPIIPPIKSRHSQKTNRKIMASKNIENMTIVETLKKKQDNETADGTHYTTGAFMTRKTAKTLADQYGFYPNPQGFVHRQNVEVLNINGYWYRGTLEMMNKGKVKVKYDGWEDQDEWIIMGSRRLRAVTAEGNATVQSGENIVNTDEYIDVVHSDDNYNDASWIDEASIPPSSPIQNDKYVSTTSFPIIPSTSHKRKDDYVSCTLDRDPTQIFNNNEVFMTRSMARGLIDEHGFKPNSFGYRRNRAVAITFYSKQNGTRKTKQECVGYLREMLQDQVRVWYPELHQSEWLPVGSRRLRVMTEEEEAIISSNKKKVNFNIQEVSTMINQLEGIENISSSISKTSVSSDSNYQADKEIIATQPESNNAELVDKKGRGRSRKATAATVDAPQADAISKSKKKNLIHEATCNFSQAIATVSTSDDTSTTTPEEGIPSISADGNAVSVFADYPVPNTIVEVQQKKADGISANQEFLTTGAFATRRAMRQLKDENGFTPNPYGYTNNLVVEILNTRSGKTKFWERGRLVAMRPGQVQVHYEGWADTYDEWFMVGSRRIRIANNANEDTPSADIKETAYTAVLSKSRLNGNSSAWISDLLIAELNPELTDEVKKKCKHQLVRPQDYQELGLLVNIEELAAKETKKRERREKIKVQESTLISGSMADSGESENGDDAGEEYLPNDKSKKKRTNKRSLHSAAKKTSVIRKKTSLQAIGMPCQQHNDEPQANKTDEQLANGETNKQIISLRLAQAKASKSYKFVANVYGYDYMQHVTVLHLDKKLYEARLVSIHKNKVKVHYCGWSDTFDEYITLGSKRLQPIENDYEVECIEANYQERYESSLLKQSFALEESTDTHPEISNASPAPPLINRFSRKRLTLEDVDPEDESSEGKVEYHKDPVTEENDEEVEEINAWKVYCNQCNVVIKQFRYYCTYCETPSLGHDYQSFELCLGCFDQNFPFWHEHPRSSFAIQAVIDAEIGPKPIKGELVTVWEEDILDETFANNELFVAASHSASENKNEDDVVNGAKDMTGENTVQLDDTRANITTLETQLTASLPPIPTNGAATPKKMSSDVQNGAFDASKIFTGSVPIDTDQGYKYLKRWRRRKVCAFCNDDDDTSAELGQFIGPFVIATFNKNGVEKKRSFWAHDSCARYSPEVFCTPEGKWYNVTLALRRGRGMRCHTCKEKGATIGCFESKCNKSFHLPCSQKPVSYFMSGVIFWCGIHEAYYNKKDTYVNIFNCDGCSKKLEDESWFTCVPCASSYFSSFDLCTECYEKFPAEHAHNEDDFEETSFAILKEMEAQKATEAARVKEEIRAANAKKKKKPLFRRRRKRLADGTLPVSCCYCGTYEAESWRKGYDGGVIICNPCFELALLVDNDGKPCDENMPLVIDSSSMELDQELHHQKYVASIEDYSHKPYFTRDTLSATKFSDSSTGPRLASYEPQPNQLFSLTFDSTYFDIPGRAPRWATHSGTDYHGTWLPQTVRRALLQYTRKDERVLSNFLGRGTDAIECFLLQRRCCGVDINPAAVALSQRNCCFEIPPGLTSAEYRPIVAQADSRKLSGSLFGDESFHHILSHPPYKDCVAYSTHLDGDLSRFTSIEDFKIEYTKVVQESWRLLKVDRRLTLGIGDNREHCFYIPVGFHLIRLYIDQGFELEELVIKRQRYCSAFGLGTYLCVQFDFLVFTHEFIATFKKLPKENTDKMLLIHKEKESALCSSTGNVKLVRTLHGVPSSAILRKSVVMGTVWVFKPTETYSFDKLCISRMVERFGRDDGNWEHIKLLLFDETHHVYRESAMEIDCGNPAEKRDHVESSKVGDELLINENPLSEYEQQRLKRIDENNKTLLKLGLISELSEESDDVIHYETMMDKEYHENGDLVLMITGHRSDLLPNRINDYRQTIVQLAKEATVKLASKGMFIVGTQDIRGSYSGKLWPMTMLVLEDIEREVGRDIIKLKEMVVTVPDGYSKDRKREFQDEEIVSEEDEDIIDIETVNHEYVPIVHAIYLVFQKF